MIKKINPFLLALKTDTVVINLSAEMTEPQTVKSFICFHWVINFTHIIQCLALHTLGEGQLRCMSGKCYTTADVESSVICVEAPKAAVDFQN